MKMLSLVLAVFAIAITTLHAQVPPVAAPVVVDPVVQAAVEAAVPAKYASYTSLGLIGLMMLGRAVKALQNGSGLKGWISAIWMGTNTPNKLPLILGALCLLTLPSCTTWAKFTAALSTPQARQIERSLADLGLVGAVAGGVLSPGDAVTIAKGVAVVTSPDDGSSKVVNLAKLGLATAVAKGAVKPGDVVQITDATAIITPAPPPIPPSNVVIPTVVPTAELESGK